VNTGVEDSFDWLSDHQFLTNDFASNQSVSQLVPPQNKQVQSGSSCLSIFTLLLDNFTHLQGFLSHSKLRRD
jgi:hypothetical protein